MNRARSLFGGVLFCLATAASAAGQAFTLEQVTGAPFNTELQAAPAGDRFVWISNQRGQRNLYVAEATGSDYTARALTHYNTDNGVDLGNITWTPDGNNVIYVRGGDFEFPSRPSPNPGLLPDGVTQEIWTVPVKGGEPRKLAEGRAPAVSPDGKLLVFLSNGQVFSRSLADLDEKPKQLFHARGDIGSLLWSPDGHYLAFTSSRGDHGFIGLFSIAERSLTYLSPSTDTDIAPVWSPDSSQIAFVRRPHELPVGGFKPHRTGPPWSIQVVEVKTGERREVWHANDGPGSVFHELATEHQLQWMAGNRLVFPSEADGWLHLYAVAATGGAATLLTPGSFEVEHLCLSADHKLLTYSSNQDAGGASGKEDIDRRHVWQLSFGGGEPTRPRPLTTGTGIEAFPAMTSSGVVAVLRSDPRVPMRPAIVTRNGELHDLAPGLIPADFPATKLIVPTQVILTAADGMQIHAQLFQPSTARAGQRHPAVVFFHGGSRREMLLGWHYMYYYSNSYAMNQYLASQGYVVLSVNYRSGIGYGLNFREALNYGAAGASEFNDVLGAGLYLRNRPDVDPARIGVWGGSYGGYLTALALARSSDLFAAGVDLHGVHDWNLGITTFDPSYNPNSDVARLAFESSPLSAVKTWRSPVLLIQGDDDRNVNFTQTVRLAAALRDQGVPVEQHVFPDEIHDFLLWRDWVEAYRLGADFFARKLTGKPN